MSKFRAGDSKFTRFINGKGFYIALALCLVAIGSAAYVATNNTMGFLGNQASSNQTISNIATTSDIDWGTGSTQQTNQNVSGVNASSSNTSITASSSVISLPKSSSSAVSKTLLFMLPCSGDVICGFSNNIPVYNKTLDDWRVQNGVDISGKLGTPVVAAADGTISDIKTDVLYGQEVIIDHGNGLKSIYGNLTPNVTVKKGQNVSVGDVLGCIGQTAQGEISLVSHVYFAMTKNNQYIDPFTLIKKQ